MILFGLELKSHRQINENKNPTNKTTRWGKKSLDIGLLVWMLVSNQDS